MSRDNMISKENNLTKKDFRQIFWRSFSLLGSFNYERMEGLGFVYALRPVLRKIYIDDDEAYKASLHRHMEAFNMTVAPAPFVMGITVAMEETAKRDPNFDVTSINAIKVALMGPLSGIGDTFFWGIFRIIACAIGVSFAKQGNIIAPFVLLALFNIPNILTRWYGLFIGYKNGSGLLTNLEESGKMDLFTYCAGIVGVAAVGCMIASWVGLSSPLAFSIAGSKIVIQEYLDQVMPELLSLSATLIIFGCLRKKFKVIYIIMGIIVVGFIAGVLGILG
ncbi:MAG: PTS system mannose/fructose/sorbose family transporter subunit IID [Erysipelotrichaceae bacterium]